MKLFIFDLDDTLYDRWGQLDETYANLPNIIPFNDTKEVLHALNTPKILISLGDQVIQQRKIEVLGIAHFFDQINICATAEEKKIFMEKAQKKYMIKNPRDIVVVGDRIDSEIKYGKMLGFVTIRMLHGKYKDLKPRNNYEKPDYTIKKLRDLLTLVKKCKL